MQNDALEDVENKIIELIPDPNTLFDSNLTLIATFNSTTSVNQFCNTYSHDNKYNGLKLGQRIQINDGTYNKAWYIAGFDCEADNIASDGTPNNNGYGICLIPSVPLTQSVWNIKNAPVPYINSPIHDLCNNTIYNNLKNTLGSHLINRNVLLGSSAESAGYTNDYTWTTAYCTLVSRSQITRPYNSFDNGEANYYLPIFDYNISGLGFWLRTLSGKKVQSGDYTADHTSNFIGSMVYSYDIYTDGNVSPMIYIR